MKSGWRTPIAVCTKMPLKLATDRLFTRLIGIRHISGNMFPPQSAKQGRKHHVYTNIINDNNEVEIYKKVPSLSNASFSTLGGR